MLLAAGDAIELTLAMPAEITLSEAMRVRCQGRVLRVVPAGNEAKYFAAVQLEKYEYLPQENGLPALARTASDLDHVEEDASAVPAR